MTMTMTVLRFTPRLKTAAVERRRMMTTKTMRKKKKKKKKKIYIARIETVFPSRPDTLGQLITFESSVPSPLL
jgi:hypothetical protein